MIHLTLKQNDVGRVLEDTLLLNGSALNLSTAEVTLRIVNPFGVAVDRDADIVNATAGTVKYIFTPEDSEVAGHHLMEWIVTFSGGAVFRFPDKDFMHLEIEASLTAPTP
jgi:hypothetical protein